MEQYFLPGDLKQAAIELECVSYLEIQTNKLVRQGQFARAIEKHKDMIKSLENLQIMRIDKQINDQTEFVLNQIKAQEESNIMFIIRKYAE